MNSTPPIPEPEIAFTGEVPLIPAIRPVIFLSGSDYNMGYQCYNQVVSIFGRWILDGVPRGPSSKASVASLDFFEQDIKNRLPEFVDFFNGMAAGASAAGVSLSYREVLATFASILSFSNMPVGEEPQCSGWAAWGKATRDSRLVCCGQQESAMHFSITIVAFPENGNSFIHMLSSMPGTDYLGSPFPFWGFPSMNNRGLVYVHHGNTGAELTGSIPGVTTGLPMGMQLLHVLRFAENSMQAREMLRATGGGGFWADTSGDAFVIENVENPFAIRRTGYAGECDFLYATNNWICRELGDIGRCRGKVYVPHAGWADFGAIPPGGRNIGRDSIDRNVEMWNLLHNYFGKIDLDFAKMTWRFSGQTPGSHHFEFHISNLNASALGVTQPHNGDAGLYYVSNGCPTPCASTSSPGAHSFLVAPTFSFYQLRLASSPAEVTAAAMQQAQYDLHIANQELRKLNYWDIAYTPLNTIYDRATAEWFKGTYHHGLARKATDNEQLFSMGRALRGFTRCQALANQVHDALTPPARNPEDLGLQPWFGKWGEWVNSSQHMRQ